MTIRALGINHIALEVHDLDEALAWWERWFEVKLRGRREHMAWIDLGDQFVALSEGGPEVPDRGRHFGLVVEDREALREELLAAGEPVNRTGSLRLRDPFGNLIEIVDYREVQFSKTPAALHALGVGELDKTPEAQQQMRDKGLLG
jgi:catechol 2,3-dioxygenase-like lactoylglutathione lyase family enzyme